MQLKKRSDVNKIFLVVIRA